MQKIWTSNIADVLEQAKLIRSINSTKRDALVADEIRSTAYNTDQDER